MPLLYVSFSVNFGKEYYNIKIAFENLLSNNFTILLFPLQYILRGAELSSGAKNGSYFHMIPKYTFNCKLRTKQGGTLDSSLCFFGQSFHKASIQHVWRARVHLLCVLCGQARTSWTARVGICATRLPTYPPSTSVLSTQLGWQV